MTRSFCCFWSACIMSWMGRNCYLPKNISWQLLMPRISASCNDVTHSSCLRVWNTCQFTFQRSPDYRSWCKHRASSKDSSWRTVNLTWSRDELCNCKSQLTRKRKDCSQVTRFFLSKQSCLWSGKRKLILALLPSWSISKVFTVAQQKRKFGVSSK